MYWENELLEKQIEVVESLEYEQLPNKWHLKLCSNKKKCPGILVERFNNR